MRSHLALTLSLALVAACFLPASAFADGSNQGISRLSTLLEHTGVADLVYGVPVQTDGLTGPDSADSGFAGDDDGDGATDAGTTDESEAPPSSTESGGYEDASNAGLNSSASDSEITALSLLQIIIGIIFGQDRPWDDENRQKRG